MGLILYLFGRVCETDTVRVGKRPSCVSHYCVFYLNNLFVFKQAAAVLLFCYVFE